MEETNVNLEVGVPGTSSETSAWKVVIFVAFAYTSRRQITSLWMPVPIWLYSADIQMRNRTSHKHPPGTFDAAESSTGKSWKRGRAPILPNAVSQLRTF